MESQPQNPEFRNDPKNFHPCICLPACQDAKNIADPDKTASSGEEACFFRRGSSLSSICTVFTRKQTVNALSIG